MDKLLVQVLQHYSPIYVGAGNNVAINYLHPQMFYWGRRVRRHASFNCYSALLSDGRSRIRH